MLFELSMLKLIFLSKALNPKKMHLSLFEFGGRKFLSGFLLLWLFWFNELQILVFLPTSSSKHFFTFSPISLNISKCYLIWWIFSYFESKKFHQHFTTSFCAHFLLSINLNPNWKHPKGAQNTFVHQNVKICSWNVSEIDTW